MSLSVFAKRATLSRAAYSAARCFSSSSVSVSPSYNGETNPSKMLAGIDLLVCDMAGTTVEEGGVVYKTLRKVMVDDGLAVSETEMHPWHGAKKEAVIAHFAEAQGTPAGPELDARVERLGDNFEAEIEVAYFQPNSPVSLIQPNVLEWIADLQSKGTKVGLDTGYPPNIQEGLMEKLNLKGAVDSHVSAYQVAEGRPYPYMIYRNMEIAGTMDVARVAKAGDSARDMEEGKNAGCGLVIGVLSGADTAEQLLAAGADVVVNNVTELGA